jgi:hypothetical protein
MNIFDQQWFWTGIISIGSVIVGSTLTILANYILEISKRKTQLKLEKIKIYDKKKFKAYLKLYNFISIAYSYYWPIDNPRRSFISLMKNHFFVKIKKLYPYFKPDIREKLKILENQYISIGDIDLSSPKNFDEFMQDDYLKILNELNITIEKSFDNWESI